MNIPVKNWFGCTCSRPLGRTGKKRNHAWTQINTHPTRARPIGAISTFLSYWIFNQELANNCKFTILWYKTRWNQLAKAVSLAIIYKMPRFLGLSLITSNLWGFFRHYNKTEKGSFIIELLSYRKANTVGPYGGTLFAPKNVEHRAKKGSMQKKTGH